MKRPFAWLAVLALACSLNVAIVEAHPGGHGEMNIPVSSEIATQIALQQMMRLSMEGTIDKSWRENGQMKSADLRELNGAKQWVVIFKNSTEFDAAKHTLYVFLSEYGDYIAANFSGK